MLESKEAQQIANHTIFTGDNLDIMRGMDSETIDLIYLDPPFNSNRHYQAPIGSKAAGAEFKDAWTLEDIKEAWWGLIADEHPALYKVIDAAGGVGNRGDKAYLIYMAMRLLEMRRLLKPTGSIYLHCDPTMSHSLKMVMDAIFGHKNFRNEIVWHYSGREKKHRQHFSRKHDVVMFYSASEKSTFNSFSIPWAEEEFLKHRHDVVKVDGKLVIKSDAADGTRYFRDASEVMKKGKPISDVWKLNVINSSAKERTGYPTQKPLALLKRIILASSNEGDMVLDPFCGCATACIAAESLGRQWIGIDISPKAAELVQIRAERELTDFFSSQSGIFEINHRTDIPVRKENVARSKNIKHLLFGKQEGKCNGCGHIFPFQNFTVDHIVPTAKGGPDSDKNLQLLCGHCNSVKSDDDMPTLMARLKAKKIGAKV